MALGILVAVIVPRMVQAVIAPAYDNINGRASVDAALEYEQAAATAVGKYYRQHHEVPPSLQAAGFDAAMPEEVSDLHLDTANGQLELRFGMVRPVTGLRLILSPVANADTTSPGAASAPISRARCCRRNAASAHGTGAKKRRPLADASGF